MAWATGPISHLRYLINGLTMIFIDFVVNFLRLVCWRSTRLWLVFKHYFTMSEMKIPLSCTLFFFFFLYKTYSWKDSQNISTASTLIFPKEKRLHGIFLLLFIKHCKKKITRNKTVNLRPCQIANWLRIVLNQDIVKKSSIASSLHSIFKVCCFYSIILSVYIFVFVQTLNNSIYIAFILKNNLIA